MPSQIVRTMSVGHCQLAFIILTYLSKIQLIGLLEGLEEENVKIINAMHDRIQRLLHVWTDLGEVSRRKELTSKSERDRTQLEKEQKSDAKYREAIYSCHNSKPNVSIRREHVVEKRVLIVGRTGQISHGDLRVDLIKVAGDRMHRHYYAHNCGNEKILR